MPFVALPLVYLVARWGVLYGLLLAVAAGALIFLVAGTSMAALMFLVLTGIGVVLGEALRRQWALGSTLGWTAAGAVAAFCVWGMVLWLLMGLDPSRLRETADGSINRAAALYAQMGVGTETTDLVSGQLRHLLDVLPYLVPGLLGMGALLLAGCSILLTYAILPRMREKVQVGVQLSKFRMHWAVAYASIAGLAMLLLSRGEGTWHSAVFYIGLNVLLVSQTLFFVQGLAVARWLAINRQQRPGPRTSLYVAAILGQVFFQLTGLVGLFDTWLDFRKRFALKSPRTGSLR